MQGGTIHFQAGKENVLYTLAAPAAVVLCTAVVAYLCRGMLLDPSAVTRACALCLAFAYGGYVLYYFVRLRTSRKHVTRSARWDGRCLEVCSGAESRQIHMDDIVFSMSYSSSTNLCIVVATDQDFTVLSCSCGYLFTRGGGEVLGPFYGINERLMELNPKHINYVKHKKYKKQNPMRIPHFIFEIEYYTARTRKLVNTLREGYRFR